ncbi:AI-2E family transporter [Abyssisolibacter fermentans]|uniref:AI-2E family transporter n=1 Tax=Abyssisolibacter fermentans TaxID=1766203 RepID=UPI000836E590|nr:AI-2E family transporter [Abyssisolibacter fermentans]
MVYIVNFTNDVRELLITALVFVILYYIIKIGNKTLGKGNGLIITKKELFKLTIFAGMIFAILKIYTSVPIVKDIIYTIIISITIAYILNPIVNYLESKGLRRITSISIIYLFIAGFIGMLYFIIVPSILEEVTNLLVDFPEYLRQINDKIKTFYNLYTVNMDSLPGGIGNIKNIIDNNLIAIENLVTKNIKNVTDNIATTFSKLVVLVLFPVMTFYFLKDKDFFKKNIILLCPKKFRDDLLKISRKMNIILGKFVRGQLIVASFIGVASAVDLLILRVKFALIIGLIAGVASIIPYFGPIIGIIPALFFALLDSTTKAIWVIITFVIIQQIEGDVLSPRIVGNSVGLHPIVVMVVLLIGGGIFGVIGMLLSVPATVFIKIILNYSIEKLDNMQ